MIFSKMMTASLVVLAMAISPAHADEVTDAIDEAIAAYEEGDLSYAQESLTFASQLIAQMKTATLADLLPDALDGWEASEAESETMGAAMFGGGSTVSKVYTKGDKVVSIQYIADSPLLAQMAVMFANPAMATAGGGKLLRIGRQKAMVDQEGTIQFLVDNRIMVEISGDAAEDDKMTYAKSIDLKELKSY